MLGQAQGKWPRQELMCVEQRERSLFAGDFGRSEIGRIADHGQPCVDQRHALGRAIARPAEDQRIGEAGDAKADAALGKRFGALLRQRKFARHR